MNYRAWSCLLPMLAWGAEVSAQELMSAPDRFDCLLEPHREVELGFSVPGIIEAIRVDPGDSVRKGQLLASLHSEVEAVGVELAAARVEFGRRKVQRTQELLKDEFVSEFNVDEAVTEFRISELELRQAEAALRRRTISSPVDGIVVELDFSPGEFVSEGTILKIMQISPLNVEVVVAVSKFGSIREGSTAWVFPEQPIGGVHEAVVTYIDKVIDAASGTFGVRLEMPNPEQGVPAGLKCRIQFSEAAGNS